MSLRFEDRELQIRLAELQIEQQHIASFYTVIVSVIVTAMVAYLIGLISIGMTTQSYIWILVAFIGYVLILPVLLWIYRMYRAELRKLNEKIQELKKQYVGWPKAKAFIPMYEPLEVSLWYMI